MSWHPSAPPGWYPDPSGQPANRWWDGVQWTPHVQPWAPPPKRRSTGWLATALGGCAAFVGAFLPWVHILLIGTLNLLQLVGQGSGKAVSALCILGAAFVVGLVGFLEPSGSGTGLPTTALVVAICAAVLAGVWGIALNADVRQAAGFASLGMGPFLTVGGFVVAAVGAGITLAHSPQPTLLPGWYERRRGRMSWWDGGHWHDSPPPGSGPPPSGHDSVRR